MAITTRDRFALQALHGIIPDCGLSATEMAERCYEVADAMMEVRARGAGVQPAQSPETAEEYHSAVRAVWTRPDSVAGGIAPNQTSMGD